MGKIVFANLGALVILLATTQGCAMGMKRPELVTVTGTVRVVGNAPFARLVLTTGDSTGNGNRQDWLLLGPLQDVLRKGHQGMKVTLEGTSCTSPLPEFARCLEPQRIVSP